MNVRFERREQLSPGIWQYYFTPERPLDYTPGQYVAVRLLHDIADPRGRSRTFTLTSVPSDPYICFAAKFTSNGSNYKRALQALQPGDPVHVDDAMGDLVLPKSPYTPLVFVAGGLGVASFVSILRQLERSGEKRDVQLFYARRTSADNPYAALLATFPFSDLQQYISPVRLEGATLVRSIREDSLVYISGSERFVEALRSQLQHAGIGHEQIVFDFFDGYTSL